MSRRWLLSILAVVVMGALALVPVAGAAPASLTVTAQVQNQTCLSGDSVQVTLSAQVSTTSRAMFAWDTNGDGRIDTRVSSNPTVTAVYPDETSQKATVFARNQEGERASSSVSFVTIRCP